MSINQRLFQDTLYDWVRGQFPDVTVLWRAQNAIQPAFPYVNLWVRNIHTWGDVDVRVSDFDDSRPAGEEIHQVIMGPRKVHVDLDVWSDSNNPDTDALNIGEALVDSLQRPDVRTLLNTAKASYLEAIYRRQMTQVEGFIQVSRYYAELIFCVESSQLVKLGYIDTVEVSSDPTNDPDFEVSQTINLE